MNGKLGWKYLLALFLVLQFSVGLQYANAAIPADLQKWEQEQKQRLSELSAIAELTLQAETTGADLLSFRENLFLHQAASVGLQSLLGDVESDILSQLATFGVDASVETETTPTEFEGQILALRNQLKTVKRLQLQCNIALTEIAQALRSIGDTRKQRFFDDVLRPHSSFRTLLLGREAIGELANVPSDVTRAVRNWWQGLLDPERKVRALAVFAIAFSLAVIIMRYLPAALQARIITSAAEKEVLSSSAKRVFVDMLPPAIAATVIYAATLWSDMGGGLVVTIIERALLCLVLLLYVSSFCRTFLGSLCRGDLGRKMGEKCAASVKFWVLTAFGTYGLLFVVRSTSLTVEMISFWVALASVIAAVSIIATTRPSQWLCDDGSSLLNSKVKIIGYITVAAIVGALGLGFIALLDLILRALAVCLALVSAMWLLRIYLRAELGAAMFAYQTPRLPTESGTTEDGESPNFLIFWIWLLVDIVLLLVLLPLLLLAVGIEWLDIYAIGRQALSGFSIGGITISVGDIFAALLTFLSILVATHLIQQALEKTVFPHTRLDDGIRNSFKTLVGYFGTVIAAAMAIGVLGLDLSSLALIVGALSVGIGFGLQSIVNNFVSGVILLFERPVKVGDWVITNSGEGTVRRISVRSTEIETFDRLSIIVPNSELISNTVQNWTHKDKVGRIIVPVSVAYKSDPKKVREILLECATAHPLALKDPPPYIYWKEFGESSLDFEVRVFLRDISTIVHVRNDLRFEIFDALKRNEIEIPFPQRDVHLIKDL